MRSRFQFVDDHRDAFEVKRLCEVLEAHQSGPRRVPSARSPAPSSQRRLRVSQFSSDPLQLDAELLHPHPGSRPRSSSNSITDGIGHLRITENGFIARLPRSDTETMAEQRKLKAHIRLPSPIEFEEKHYTKQAAPNERT